jgi:hypothetical protein
MSFVGTSTVAIARWASCAFTAMLASTTFLSHFRAKAEACAQAAVPGELAACPEGTGSNEEWATWLQQWWIAFFETRHEPARAVASIPALRDLDRIALIAHRVEDRLLAEARWERTEAARLNEAQLCGADRAVQDDELHQLGG